MPAHSPLEHRFVDHLRSLGVGAAPARLLVAVSGGCDSVALLFLLRFCSRSLPLTLSAAHLDHAMRPDSAADALWVRGLCAAWEVPLVSHRLASAPRGETEARRARYRFLRHAAREVGADLIVTAHHADDQAETVLFRIVRGSGLEGLGGIRPRSAGLLRPLLPFWRRELQRFAGEKGLRWRSDPSNLSSHPARNRLRREVLPLLERHVAPAARRNLVALAELAREAEAALQRDAARAARRLTRTEGGALLLARNRLRDYDLATGSRIVRKLLRRFGVVPSRTGTRRALQFITDAASGREMQLPGGVRIRLEFDVARIEAASAPPPDVPLHIAEPEGGSGEATIGGRRVRVRFGRGRPDRAAAPSGWCVTAALGSLRFPLQLRGWAAGDRMRTAGGTKTLKKLFLEHRIPRSQRRQLPVLVDASGSILWVAGVPRDAVVPPGPGDEAFFLTALHD